MIGIHVYMYITYKGNSSNSRTGELTVSFRECVTECCVDNNQQNSTATKNEDTNAVKIFFKVSLLFVHLLIAPNGGDFFSNHSLVYLRTSLNQTVAQRMNHTFFSFSVHDYIAIPALMQGEGELSLKVV